MIKAFFITGTDTNIGKTLVSCALLQAAVHAGYRAIGCKPIASGCKLTSEGLQNSDALALMKNSNVSLKYSQVNQLAFIESTSPNIASRNEGRPILFTELSKNLRILEDLTDWLIIEGAGGWLTPLSEKLSYADWVSSEKLPVILVVGIKLGCINHALLTLMAIQQKNLPLAGWIANHLTSSTAYHWRQDYLLSLKQKLNIPLLGEIPWLNSVKNERLANYLDLSLL